MSAAFLLIPQALAYASLAGMPVQHGLYAAAAAPLAASFFASSPYLGTGPTAITSLLAFGALVTFAEPASSRYVALGALLALLVGAVRVILGLLRAGFLAYLMSQPIVTGFTTGGAIVIVASQVPAIVDVKSNQLNPILSASEALSDPAQWRMESIALAVFVGFVILTGKWIHRLFPGILVAVGLAIAYSATTHYGGAVVGQGTSGWPTLALDLPWTATAGLVLPAIVIAVVGFSEPAAIARHYATLERKKWDPDQELLSQGVANLAAGLVRGFPVGGSFSRTSVVRDAGARTRLAGAITGLTVLAILPFTTLLSSLPQAALAAIVIVTIAEIIELQPFRDYRRYASLQFAVAILTLMLTIAFAPHVERAVLVGVGVAIAAHLWRELRLSIPAWTLDGVLHLAPKGVLYFASAPGLEKAFTKLLNDHPDARALVVHLDGLGRIDLTGALVLRDLLNDVRKAGLDAEVVDVPPPAQKIVARVIEEGQM